ncbi:MAG: hypothetical protein HY672_04915 [Chloroflexi bacterium]|nr:hypothetical protein [Chloroflexota bacterium]
MAVGTRVGQQGFTLIELLALIAILAILVILMAIIAVSVTNSRNTSVNAQVMQDAIQVRSAATNYTRAGMRPKLAHPTSVIGVRMKFE